MAWCVWGRGSSCRGRGVTTVCVRACGCVCVGGGGGGQDLHVDFVRDADAAGSPWAYRVRGEASSGGGGDASVSLFLVVTAQGHVGAEVSADGTVRVRAAHESADGGGAVFTVPGGEGASRRARVRRVRTGVAGHGATVRVRHWWESPEMHWRVGTSVRALLSASGAVVDVTGRSAIPVGGARGRRLLDANLAAANSNV